MLSGPAGWLADGSGCGVCVWVAEKGLSPLLLSFPNVLSITAERIRASAQLLHDLLGCTKDDFRDMLQRHPQLLGEWDDDTPTPS